MMQKNMIVRTAVLDGIVAPEDLAEFRKNMEVLQAMVVNFEGVRDVKVRFLSTEVAPEENAPLPQVSFDFYFDSVAAMNNALAGPLRQQTRAEIQKSLHIFTGRVYHFVREEIQVKM